ncbi:MAG: Gfo/Idh/MocA family oxidoreductase [Lacipirellulaceae bacterium]
MAKDQTTSKPVRLGVVGLVHTHVHAILGRPDRGDVEIVGIAEPNTELAERYAKQHGYGMDLVYPSLEEMVEATQPDAVAAFNTIHGHLEVVRVCAPRGIHVMVEKPLAVCLAHARDMAELARKHNILLLTNYETTWYASNAKALKLVREQALGKLRKVVVHDGHPGPKEIGVNVEFLEWLVDPELNGGGALPDFGCYGANLVSQLMDNERPLSVTAITQQFKPDVYPDVEDEATILIRYPKMIGIVQASWNWPFPRKDMEIYGETGQVICVDGSRLRVRFNDDAKEREITAPRIPSPRDDPFSLLAAAVRGKVEIQPTDLSSLENNLLVMEILEAAKQSAEEGRTIELD